ncbi:hypothetical protein I3843_04G169600 [Carya illinoinensis]|uniref:Uncharacterized protein n=1 Tax=Carya illinoinensis TaxID=32201 RepID=A0A922FF74_CARIL|nr:hypothetical protein I3842_04G179500 [Carya illinoinensis]KAG7984625.1 hypothetical protein I3843_04G169600 [Carya illinoinensis]
MAIGLTNMASTVLLTLMFLMPLFYFTSTVLFHFRCHLDFMACLFLFLGVLFISVPTGLVIVVSFVLLPLEFFTLLSSLINYTQLMSICRYHYLGTSLQQTYKDDMADWVLLLCREVLR